MTYKELLHKIAYTDPVTGDYIPDSSPVSPAYNPQLQMDEPVVSLSRYKLPEDPYTYLDYKKRNSVGEVDYTNIHTLPIQLNRQTPLLYRHKGRVFKMHQKDAPYIQAGLRAYDNFMKQTDADNQNNLVWTWAKDINVPLLVNAYMDDPTYWKQRLEHINKVYKNNPDYGEGVLNPPASEQKNLSAVFTPYYRFQTMINERDPSVGHKYLRLPDPKDPYPAGLDAYNQLAIKTLYSNAGKDGLKPNNGFLGRVLYTPKSRYATGLLHLVLHAATLNDTKASDNSATVSPEAVRRSDYMANYYDNGTMLDDQKIDDYSADIMLNAQAMASYNLNRNLLANDIRKNPKKWLDMGLSQLEIDTITSFPKFFDLTLNGRKQFVKSMLFFRDHPFAARALGQLGVRGVSQYWDVDTPTHDPRLTKSPWYIMGEWSLHQNLLRYLRSKKDIMLLFRILKNKSPRDLKISRTI